MARTSNKENQNRDLGISKEAKELLEGLANLPDGANGFGWFKAKFPYVIEQVNPWVVRHWAINTEQEDYIPGGPDEKLMLKYWLLPLRETLQEIWRAPDLRTKEWGTSKISERFFQQGKQGLVHAPLSSSSDELLTMKPINRAEQLLAQLPRVPS